MWGLGQIAHKVYTSTSTGWWQVLAGDRGRFLLHSLVGKGQPCSSSPFLMCSALVWLESQFLIIVIQLTSEEQGHEWRRSTYMQIFFNKYYRTTRWSVVGWTSDVELWLRRADCGTWASVDFDIHSGSWSQSPLGYWGMTLLFSFPSYYRRRTYSQTKTLVPSLISHFEMAVAASAQYVVVFFILSWINSTQNGSQHSLREPSLAEIFPG